jgi:hypothetical protein
MGPVIGFIPINILSNANQPIPRGIRGGFLYVQHILRFTLKNDRHHIL